MTEETRELMFSRGTVWAVGTSGWAGTDRLNAEDLDKEAEDIPDIFSLGSKKLLPYETRNKLLAPRQQVQSLMQRLGRSFLGIRGVYFLPDKNLILAREGVDRIKEKMAVVVEDFISNFPAIKTEMIENYPVLQNATWPSADQIRDRFRIYVNVFEVGEASMNAADPEELIEAKKEFAQQLNTDFEIMKDSMLVDAHQAICDSCAEIAYKIQEAGEKITEATLKKPRRIIDEYLAVAELFDSDAIKEEVSRLKATVDQVVAKDLRHNWRESESFAESLKDLGSNIGDLAGLNSEGHIKRKVKFDKAA